MSDLTQFHVGDVVYIEGASALLADVTKVQQDEEDPELQHVSVTWRATPTVETNEDLTLIERCRRDDGCGEAPCVCQVQA